MNILSFNCEGAQRNKNCVKHIIETSCPDVFCLQETWLMDSNMLGVLSIDDMYNVVGKCGMDLTKGILTGRPHGGTSILYKKSLDKYVKIVHCKSRRLFAIELSNGDDVSILIANVYMPCDNRDSIVNCEFSDVIDELDFLIASSHVSQIILCGDWNCDFNRNTVHVRYLRDFLARNQLYNMWDNPNAT